jgi:hypothetical protein
VRVRSARGYLLVDVAVGAVLSLVLAAALAPTVHEARMRGMDVGLAARLHLLRGAVWMFQADHNGVAPAPDRIEEQLLNWTDGAGNTNPSRTSVYLTSPYLRQIPALNVGSRAGARAIGPDDRPGVGWIYSAGVVRANTARGERDARGVEFLDY